MLEYEQKMSKFLTLLLRHNPSALHLSMTSEGWVDVQELINKMSIQHPFSIELLERILAKDVRGFFTLSEDGSKIRATDGHSLDVKVELEPVSPPKFLYKYVPAESLNNIAKSGLIPAPNSSYVRLYTDKNMAKKGYTGQRKSTVLKVSSLDMYTDGLHLYRTSSDIYLTEAVPTEYMEVLDLGSLQNDGKIL